MNWTSSKLVTWAPQKTLRKWTDWEKIYSQITHLIMNLHSDYMKNSQNSKGTVHFTEMRNDLNRRYLTNECTVAKWNDAQHLRSLGRCNQTHKETARWNARNKTPKKSNCCQGPGAAGRSETAQDAGQGLWQAGRQFLSKFNLHFNTSQWSHL